MSKKTQTTEIDKQLQTTFETYVVAPIHNDVDAQLASLQKKWLGEERARYDEDTPYMETLVDGCIQRVASKVDRVQKDAKEQFSGISSILQDVRDDTEEISNLAVVVDAVSEEVHGITENLSVLEKSLSTILSEIDQQNELAKTTLKNEVIRVIDVIQGTSKDGVACVEKYAGQITRQISEQAEAMSQLVTEEHTALREQLIKTEAELQETSDKNQCFLLEQLRDSKNQIQNIEEQLVEANQLICTTLETVTEITQQHSADKDALHKLLYFSLILNGATFVGVIATLLTQLLS